MIDAKLAPYGVFLLRVSLGAMFVAHALLKYVVLTMPGFAGFLAQTGFPSALAWPIFLAELLGGLAIVAASMAAWSRSRSCPSSWGLFWCIGRMAGCSRPLTAAGSIRPS